MRGDQLVAWGKTQPANRTCCNEDAAVDGARKLFPVYQVPVCVDAEVEVRLGCEIEVGLAIDQNGPCVPGRRVRRDHVGFIGRVGAGIDDPHVGVGDDDDISRLPVVVLQH